ncbi:class I SAM-dependent methyltransferase, partial [Bradyrhizobium sp.]|uniref:class I SAM-dependent methyltransferase n=1 Tax=Bradyrhizobium sp. TaxID=376 RepID=UPI003C450B10
MPRPKPGPAIHPFDQLHGTDTSGLIPGHVIAEGTDARVSELTAYYGVAPSILHGLLDIWFQRTSPQPREAQPDIERTVFLDIGAGKGRAMLVASQFPFLRVEGVELNADLARIANANISLWHNDLQANALSPLSLHHADATTHPLPPEPTLAFLFHPFELPILRRFLRHVEQSISNNPRHFDLLYV